MKVNELDLKFSKLELKKHADLTIQHLVNRILIDEGKHSDSIHELGAFLRDTWYEIPDRVSASRMMRPQFIERERHMDYEDKEQEEREFIPASAIYVRHYHPRK